MRVARTILASCMLLLASGLIGCDSDSDDNYTLAVGATSPLFPDARIFVIDSSSGELRVIDGNEPSQSTVSNALDLGGLSATAFAVDPIANTLWVLATDGTTTNEVRIFNARTMQAVTTLTTVGTNPRDLAIDVRTGRAFIANRDDNTVTVLETDAPYAEVAGSPLAVGTSPVAVAVASGTTDDFFVVANQGSSNISVFDTSSLVENAASPYAVGAGPSDLAVDSSDRIVFVLNATAGSVSTFNVVTEVVAAPIAGLVGAIEISRHSQRDLLFVAETGGRVRVFDSGNTFTQDVGSPITVGGVLGGVTANGFLDRVFVSVNSTGLIHILRGESPFTELSASNRPAVGTAPGTLASIEPQQLRRLTDGDFPDGIRSVVVINDTIYCATNTTGLLVLDNSDPRATFSEAARTTMDFDDNIRGVNAKGDFLYFTDMQDETHIANIRDKFSPVVVRTVITGVSNELEITNENFLIVDNGTSGITILDVSRPAQAILAAEGSGGGSGFTYLPDTQLIVTGDITVPIIRAFNFGHPPLVGDPGLTDVPVLVNDVAGVPGGLVAVASGIAGVNFIEVGDGPGRVPTSNSDLRGEVTRVFSLGKMVFAMTIDNVVSVIDATEPAAPRVLGSFSVPAEANEIRQFGNEVYISCGTGGLLIYRIFP